MVPPNCMISWFGQGPGQNRPELHDFWFRQGSGMNRSWWPDPFLFWSRFHPCNRLSSSSSDPVCRGAGLVVLFCFFVCYLCLSLYLDPPFLLNEMTRRSPAWFEKKTVENIEHSLWWSTRWTWREQCTSPREPKCHDNPFVMHSCFWFAWYGLSLWDDLTFEFCLLGSLVDVPGLDFI